MGKNSLAIMEVFKEGELTAREISNCTCSSACRSNVRIVLMLTVLTPMKRGYSEGQMMEAVHVAATTWWSCLVHEFK
jgi:hypothetical protein